MKHSPRTVPAGEEDLLYADQKDIPNGYIVVGFDKVALVNQRKGERSTGEVSFTRAEFNRLIDWYNKEQP